MKTVSFVAGALAGAATFVLGAAAASAQPTPAPTYDWSGVYVGVNTGWTGSNTHASSSTANVNQLTGVNNGTTTVTVPPTTFTTAPMDYSSQNWTVGGQLGFNRQMGPIVWGLEGDMDAVAGHAHQASAYALSATTGLTTGSTVDMDRFTDTNWTSSVRGRLGWAFGRMLVYGTGGLALADVRQGAYDSYAPTTTTAVNTANAGTTFGPYSAISSEDHVLTGWTVGGGAEFAVGRGISVGAEYRHSDYGNPRYNLGYDQPNGVYETTRVGYSDDQVLAKVNFRFR